MATNAPAMKSQRDRLIRLIHVAKRELMLDDATYRAMLLAVTGKSSSSELRGHELTAVLDHLKGKGFKVRSHKQSRPLAQNPDAKKIRALWLLLHEIGAVKNPSEEALSAYVKRIAQVDALQWLYGKKSEKVIESLKKWAMRFLPDAVRRLASQIRLDAELNLQIAIAFERMTFDPMLAAWEILKEAPARPK